MTDHFDAELAIAYAYRLMDAAEFKAWKGHLLQCPACGEMVRQVERNQSGVVEALEVEEPSKELENRILSRLGSERPANAGADSKVARTEGVMVQPAAPRRSVGPIAVQLGLITREQLQSAQAAQARSPGKSLDQVLVDLKLLNPDQVRSILQETSRHSTPAPATLPPKPSPRTPQAPRRHAAAPAGDSRKMWILAGAMGLIPVIGLVAYLTMGSKPVVVEPEAPPVVKVKGAPTPTQGLQPPPGTTTPPVTPKKVQEVRIRATLKKVAGNSDIAQRWNSAVDKINSMRDPEQYKPVLPELEVLVRDSRKTDHEDDVKDGFRDVLQAIKERGEQVYGFIADEVSRLTTAGKYGDALKSWEWFPGNLDLVGDYAKRIEAIRKKTLDDGRAFYKRITGDAERLIRESKLPEAQLALQKALEIDFPEFTEDAYRRVNELTMLMEAADKKAAEEEVARFARDEAEKGEAAGIEARLQGQFLEMVSRRRFDAVKELLDRQGATANAPVKKAIEGMKATLDEIRRAFDLVATGLAPQVDRTVTLAFLENGEAKNRSLKLKAVRDGKLVYTVEGREFSTPVTDLHATELRKIAGGLPLAEKDFLTGVAAFLSGELDEAHTILTGTGDRAKALVAFVEGSSDFLAKNAAPMKERAARHVAAKEWEKAVPLYSRLLSVPSEKKEALRGRARAYYQLGNFAAVMYDLRSLFQMDDFAPEVIDLLNLSYNRSAQISIAAEMYETASARLPKRTELVENLFKLYMATHQYDKARATLKRGLDGGAIGASKYDGWVAYATLIERHGMEGTVHKSQFGRYDVVTDISPEFANKMAQIMDEVYKGYSKYFKYKKNETLRFKVIVFRNETDFLKYNNSISGINFPPGTRLGAWYSGGAKQLVGFDLHDWEEMRSTFSHEGLHQFLDYFVDDCPTWFNEGMASIFETSTVDEIRFNQERHQAAKAWIKDPKNDFKDLFMLDHRTFQSKGAIMYGPSWAAVYYFIVNGQKSVLDTYLEALMEGKDRQQVFDAIFGPGKINFEEFDAKLRRAIFNDEYKEKPDPR